MFGIENGLAITALLLGIAGTSVAACHAKRDEGAPNRQPTNVTQGPTPTPTAVASDETPAKGEIEVLAKGSYSRVEEWFVAVVRDVETYTTLRELADGLPELKADFFRAHAVAAAFLGTRNTGGFGVEITRTGEGHLRMTEKAPPKDAMTTQALTQPYWVVSVPVSDEESLQFDLPEKPAAKVRSLKVTSGEFKTGGGFAGRSENFKFDGSVSFVRHEKLVTLFLDLREVGGKGRTLRGAATGILQSDGQFTIASTGAGTFIQMPRSPLRVTGNFNQKETGLTLEFASLPARVSDGFSGGGILEATGDMF